LDALKQFSGFDSSQISENSIVIEQPKDKLLGDLSTNAAMAFSKKIQVTTKVIAESIRWTLMKNQDIETVEIADPGFVNFKLKNSAWQKVIQEILEAGENYSFTNIGNGALMNVEFVSANPTGPLHTGHARNAVFGSVTANLMEKIGYKVTREFYINDRGNQITSLAKSLYLRYRETLGASVKNEEFTEDMYCGEYIKELAHELVNIYRNLLLNKEESELLDLLSKFAIERMLDGIKKDLLSLGVVMDKYTSESDICNKHMVEEAIAILANHGDIYEGILPKPKGRGESETDWEERPQALFKATKYGDDIDRAIRKSDGSWTYFAGDLAYHLDKIKRGYKRMIAILGADHNGYAKRLKAAVAAMSDGEAEIEIRLYQLVNFLENGEPAKMSKRSGNFITLKDVIERVGKDVTRYMMISRHHDVMIDFDFVKVIGCSMDNPIFYIQYAYARICSVFRNYEAVFGQISQSELINCDKSILSDESEVSLLKSLAFWPEHIKAAAVAIEPHRITNYLQNISYNFHSLWNRGKIKTELRFIDKSNKELTVTRLSLLAATKCVLEDGFKIMGITPLSEMI
jgi:arginyl-tRNA synthetase